MTIYYQMTNNNNYNNMFKTRRLLISMLTLLCCCTGAWAESTSDVLSGLFTINNSGTRVQFSKGNLQYVNGTYRFAEHQYDYFGNNQDWFSYNNYSAPSDGISWYVLSQAEWEYLFVSRTVTNTLSPEARYSKATIGGTYKGVIVFPDNYTHPEGTGFTGNCENAEEAYTSTVSLEGWALMEAAGCVFLPAAGYSTKPGQVHQAAVYQSTTSPRSDYCYTPGFYSDKMDMKDESKTSTGVPVRFVKQYELPQDSEGYYLLGSVQDWKDFAEMVNRGTNTAVNAKMTADIDLGDDQTKIGIVDSKYYSGTFDGQGYTLTIRYVHDPSKYVDAPFLHINNATIKNIHIAGTINSEDSQPAPIGLCKGTNTIENLWSSLVINCTPSGTKWQETSAIVGLVQDGSLTIRDCIYTGSNTSTGSYNGCFVGYINSGGSATITNCLSVGEFNYSGSSSGFRGTHTNCYVKQFPATYPAGVTQTTDATLADGTTATALQAGRTEEVWVQDPLTNQPMLKTFATVAYKVPSSGVGTFSSKAKFVVPEGLTAYYCKTYNAANGTISVVPIEGNVVPANTGVVLRGTGGDTYTLTGTNSEAATITDNALVAVTEATHVDQVSGNYTNFMMSGGKFIKIAASNDPDVKMPANRAYLQILTSQITGSQAIQLWWDDETTSLNSIENGKLIMDNDVWYTLDGRLVANGQSQLPRGIYIHNGKKVVIK